jgi:hypothetical protein
MFSLRRSFIPSAVSILLLAVAASEADSQNASNSPPKTAAELATAIAIAIDTRIPKTPNVPIVFESATSHDNYIEVHYRATDARFFPHNKAEGDERRLRLTNYFCFTPQIWLFRRNGVVIHQVLAAPDNSDPFEFTVDQSACAAMVEDAKTLAQEIERKHSGSTQPTTDPKRVHTLTIRPNQTQEK